MEFGKLITYIKNIVSMANPPEVIIGPAERESAGAIVLVKDGYNMKTLPVASSPAREPAATVTHSFHTLASYGAWAPGGRGPDGFSRSEWVGAPAAGMTIIRSFVDSAPERGSVTIGLMPSTPMEEFLNMLGDLAGFRAHPAVLDAMERVVPYMYDDSKIEWKIVRTVQGSRSTAYEGTDEGAKLTMNAGTRAQIKSTIPTDLRFGLRPLLEFPEITLEAHVGLEVERATPNSDPVPKFRVVWKNRREFEDMLLTAVEQRLKAAGHTKVYRGVPSSVIYDVEWDDLPDAAPSPEPHDLIGDEDAPF